MDLEMDLDRYDYVMVHFFHRNCACFLRVVKEKHSNRMNSGFLRFFFWVWCAFVEPFNHVGTGSQMKQPQVCNRRKNFGLTESSKVLSAQVKLLCTMVFNYGRCGSRCNFFSPPSCQTEFLFYLIGCILET